MPLKTKSFKTSLAQLRYAPRDLFIIFSIKFAESTAYYAFAYVYTAFLSDEFGFTDVEATDLTGDSPTPSERKSPSSAGRPPRHPWACARCLPAHRGGPASLGGAAGEQREEQCDQRGGGEWFRDGNHAAIFFRRHGGFDELSGIYCRRLGRRSKECGEAVIQFLSLFVDNRS